MNDTTNPGGGDFVDAITNTTQNTDQTTTDESTGDVIDAASEAAAVVEDQQLPPWMQLESAPETVKIQIGEELVDVPIAELAQHFGIRPEKFKLAVDGGEEEVEWNDLQSAYNKRKTAAQQFTEAQKMRQQVEQAFLNVQQNPMQGLMQISQALGVDFRQVAESYLTGELERQMMDPGERELMDTKAKLQRIEGEKKQAAEFQQMQEMQAKAEQQSKIIQADIAQTLSDSGLPNNQNVQNRMLSYLATAYDQGQHNIQPKDVVDLVRKDLINEVQSMMGLQDTDKLIELIGKENVTKLRKQQAGQVKTIPGKQQIGNGTAPKAEKKGTKMTKAEAKAYLDDLGV